LKEDGRARWVKVESLRYAGRGKLKVEVLTKRKMKLKKSRHYGVEEKAEKIEKWLPELYQFLEEYRWPNDQTLKKILTESDMEPGPVPDTSIFRGEDLVRPKDEISLLVDLKSMTIKKIRIDARLKNDIVWAEVDGAELEGGLNYVR
jgi:hypothetical protein